MAMKRSFFNLFKKRANPVKLKVYPEGDLPGLREITGYIGDNLLDTLNDQNMQDLSVFGICDKQLACHSCRINVKKNFDKFPESKEDEKDVLYDLDRLYIEGQTRMSCQVYITEDMEGAVIEIPRSAFAFFEKNFGDDEFK